jgi:cytochrome b561
MTLIGFVVLSLAVALGAFTLARRAQHARQSLRSSSTGEPHAFQAAALHLTFWILYVLALAVGVVLVTSLIDLNQGSLVEYQPRP